MPDRGYRHDSGVMGESSGARWRMAPIVPTDVRADLVARIRTRAPRTVMDIVHAAGLVAAEAQLPSNAPAIVVGDTLLHAPSAQRGSILLVVAGHLLESTGLRWGVADAALLGADLAPLILSERSVLTRSA